jgi:hypothetical protein
VAIVFKDLHKLVSHSQQENIKKELFERLKDKPFWIWNVEEHRKADFLTNGYCCLNHIIGLPQKGGNDKPLFDYEEILFDSLITHASNDNNKHLWIKKATGLGVSEFMLRFMAWLCLKDNALSDSQMCIVTGPRIDLAIALIDRMKLFASSKGMILEDNGGRIAINLDKFDKLITSLRTAVDNDGTLDKESTSYNDIFDAFRLALKFYHFRDSNGYD